MRCFGHRSKAASSPGPPPKRRQQPVTRANPQRRNDALLQSEIGENEDEPLTPQQDQITADILVAS